MEANNVPKVSGFMARINEAARKSPKRIVFPEGEERRTILASEIAIQQGIAQPILLGNVDAILSAMKLLNISTINSPQLTLIDPSSSPRFEEYASTFQELRKAKGMNLAKARQTMLDTCYFGTMMLKCGDADGLISGAIHPTSHTLLPAFQIIKTRDKFHRASGMFFMILDADVLLFADSAVTIEPDKYDLAEIAIDTAESARSFGIEPRIAMLSFSTNGSAKHPMSDKVRESTELVRYRRPDLCIEGEMQVDAALVPDVCELKFPGSALKGNANILIFPDLNAANIGYKIVQRLGGAAAIGPIIQGLNMPVNDLSRGCSVRDIVELTAVTVVQAQQGITKEHLAIKI